MARSLKDSRMLDLPISSLFCRAILGEQDYFQFNDLQSLDCQLHRSLQQLKTLIQSNQTDNVEGLLITKNKRILNLSSIPFIFNRHVQKTLTNVSGTNLSIN